MGFGVDMAKAREIHKTNIRTARTPKLAELDIEFQKALETSILLLLLDGVIATDNPVTSEAVVPCTVKVSVLTACTT